MFIGYFSLLSSSTSYFALNSSSSSFIMQLQRSHQPFYGPNVCKRAPKNNIEVKKEIPIVEQMITANF
jgi:hypothetical protein